MTDRPTDIGLIKKIPCFSGLSDKELQDILAAEDNFVTYHKPKEGIVREAEIGDCMYVVLDGIVEVRLLSGTTKRVSTAATLSKGDFFGEQSLMPWSDGRRGASVVAMLDTVLFRITKRHVLYAVERCGLQNPDGEEEEEPDPLASLLEIDEEVISALKSSRFFKTLTDKELRAYETWSQTVDYSEGETILRQGDEGDCMYLIIRGQCRVMYPDARGKMRRINILGPGKFFGEQALLPGGGGRRNAYIAAVTDCHLLQVNTNMSLALFGRDKPMITAIQKIGAVQRDSISRIRTQN